MPIRAPEFLVPVCYPSWCRLCAFAIYETFAAKKSDGSVVTWGRPNSGGDSSAVSQHLAPSSATLAPSSTTLAFNITSETKASQLPMFVGFLTGVLGTLWW